LDLDLGQEVHDVLGAAVELRLALLAAIALGLDDRHALDAQLLQGFLHLVQLERLDDGFDLFHRSSDAPPPNRLTGGRGFGAWLRGGSQARARAGLERVRAKAAGAQKAGATRSKTSQCRNAFKSAFPPPRI